MNEIYILTNRERWAALATLHRKWGDVQLADHYLELAEADGDAAQ